ncbi:MAG: hypothetical protein ORO03_05660 [Alphaproteobacteria bacterium]|nr:hypothetical protein [Alphaproteobacteria bacterium]
MAPALFIGNNENRLDSKNRLSVPADYRAQLKRLGSGTEPLILYASPDLDPYSGDAVIFCYPEGKIVKLEEEKSQLDPFHPRHIEIRSLQSYLRPLPIDGEGRVQLPDSLKEWGRLRDSVVIVGIGDCFYLSHPVDFARRKEADAAAALARNAALRSALATAQAGGVR